MRCGPLCTSVSSRFLSSAFCTGSLNAVTQPFFVPGKAFAWGLSAGPCRTVAETRPAAGMTGEAMA